MEQNTAVTLEKIASLSKRRGFVYPTSEIYGGLTSSYDYGPLGAELLRNIRNLWWHEMITTREDMVGIDSQILLHPETWVASGHVTAFNDPLVEDKVTHKRYRADHLIEQWLDKHPEVERIQVDGMGLDEIGAYIEEHNVTTPEGNGVFPPKAFNIMFQTAIGVVEGEKMPVYLRGETAQGIFTNFNNIVNSTRIQLPFGVGQIGKSFRNEITTGQFIFRTLEFEQAEIEYFFDPEKTEWEPLFKSWQDAMYHFVNKTLGINADKLRWRRHSDQERSFYSKDTYDLEYEFPFGFKELWGIAYRTNYDLQQHIDHSGKDLSYQDPQDHQHKFVPHVIEPAVGVNRLLLMALCDAYWEDVENKRTVMRFKPNLAPYKAAVFPLVKNKPEIIEKARGVYDMLAAKMGVVWDDRGNIGKRYFYQDEIGTPFCITVDYQTLEDNTVTVRERDSMQQERVSLDELTGKILAAIEK